MSNLSGNPYVESSRNQNHQSNESLTQATYALAYEQRTANLIAWLAYVKPQFISGSPEVVEITGRLGL